MTFPTNRWFINQLDALVDIRHCIFAKNIMIYMIDNFMRTLHGF